MSSGSAGGAVTGGAEVVNGKLKTQTEPQKHAERSARVRIISFGVWFDLSNRKQLIDHVISHVSKMFTTSEPTHPLSAPVQPSCDF